MKKIILALFCGSVLLHSCTGCKENHAPLSYGIASVDTTYVLAAGSIPAAEPRQVLVEEFTGAKCTACPAAHTLLENMAKIPKNAGRINLVAMHPYDVGQAVPPAGSAHDFRDSAVNQINATIYAGKNFLPAAGVNRVPEGVNMLLVSTEWANAVTTQLSLTDSLNLSIESKYNAATNVATIIATVTYVYPVYTPQNLSIVIVEDSMHDIQELPTSVDHHYEFNHVFRDKVTSVPVGNALGTLTAKEPGRVYQRVFSYTPKVMTPAMIPAHCRVIAFVNNDGAGGNYRVIQSKQCKLTGP